MAKKEAVVKVELDAAKVVAAIAAMFRETATSLRAQADAMRTDTVVEMAEKSALLRLADTLEATADGK